MILTMVLGESEGAEETGTGEKAMEKGELRL